MKVALTGASGFIGRHAIDALLRRSVEIVPIVRDAERWRQLKRSDSGAGELLEPVVLDIADLRDADSAAIGTPDVLIHLAWGGLPNYRSLHHFEHELPWHYAFLRRMIETGLSAVVVTGTCFEYGMQSGCLAETNTARPDNAYGLAKDVLRRQLELLRMQCPFRLAWARLFYPYGRGQNPQSLLSQLQRAVEQGETIFNMSGGEQLRDYMPVEAVAERLVELALARADCGVVNICSGEPISVRRLVETWLAHNGWEIALNLGHYPYPDYEPMAFWGSADKLGGVISSLGRGGSEAGRSR